jgi:hypothetical protein
MARQALETQWYHLVTFTGMSLGSASNGDGSLKEFILGALNEIGDLEDCDKGYESEDYDVFVKEFEAQLALDELEEKQAAARQVFMTNKGDDGGQAIVDLLALGAPCLRSAGRSASGCHLDQW